MQLSAEESHARYLKSGNFRKVQLINGMMRMPSPVRFEAHDEPNNVMITLIVNYSAKMAGVRSIGSATLKLDSRNNIQPEFELLREDGSSTIENDYIVGPVELVGEISESSIRGYTTSKFEAYRAIGSKEYMIWKTVLNEIVLYKLVYVNYEEIVPVDGTLKSQQFPGLHIDTEALITNSHQRAMERLNSVLDELTQ